MHNVTNLHRFLLQWASAAVAISVLFLLVPEIDILVSGWFGEPDGFPLSKPLFLDQIRETLLLGMMGIPYLALILMLLKTTFKGLRALNTHFLMFVFISAVLGPVIIVNGILKQYSGRVRPRSIDVFGGDGTFSPFLDFTGMCSKNCSFSSGEAAGFATVAAIVIVAVVPHVRSSIKSII